VSTAARANALPSTTDENLGGETGPLAFCCHTDRSLLNHNVHLCTVATVVFDMQRMLITNNVAFSHWHHRARTVLSMATEGSYTYKWPRPAVTVDTCVIAGPEIDGGTPVVLLIQRKNDPFAGHWALPGGFVDELEELDAAAARELQEETSVDPAAVALEQVKAFGGPGRDPRGWTITVAYVAIVRSQNLGVKVHRAA
jgi:ADP-ribose pyrophosphatase YjhB (NUDIX family)